MQSNPFLRITLAVIFLGILASCHTNTQGKFIPKDAVVVIVADSKSLASKLPWNEIKKNAQLQKTLTDSRTSPYIKNLLNNPDSSGVDLQSDLIMFLEKDSAGAYFAFEGNIKDPNLFKRFGKKLLSGAEESSQAGVNYLNSYPNCMGWNDEKFICICDMPEFRGMGYSGRNYESRSRDAVSTTKELFALDGSNSLAKNEKFTNLLKESGDIRFWVNGEKFYTGMSSSGPLAALNLDEVYKDNVTTAILSFDNGKISVNTKSYTNDKMMDFYKKYMSDKLSDDMLKRIPGKDVDIAFAMNLKTEGIKALLTTMGAEGMINGQLRQVGLSMDDISKAFKGDFVFGLTDMNMKLDSVSYQLPSGFSYKMPKLVPDYNLVFAGSIGDKDAFNKINNFVQAEVNHNMVYSEASPPVSIDNNGNFFAVSNKKEITAQYLSGNTSNFDFISSIDGQAAGGYINIAALLKGCEGLISKDSTSQDIYNASLKMWKNVTFKGGDIHGDAVTGSLEINLIDNSTNSLKQLNQYFAAISLAIEQGQERLRARYLNEMNNNINQGNNSIEQPPVPSLSNN